MQPRKIGLYALIAIGAGLLLAIVWGVLSQRKTVAPTVNNSNTTINAPANTDEPVANTNTDEPLTDTSFFTTNDLPDRDDHFNFSANLPSGWAAEYVDASQAINFFDPQAEGDSMLNQSQIFVKYFVASEFQTLTTVDIISRTETTINGRPAVTYIIKKKASAPDFPSQPVWRNDQHRVTDIRLSDDSSSTFYVFAKAPSVSDATFDAFLNSVKFTSLTTGQVVYPLNQFVQRVTKKQFGQYITPQNSPIQPERFSGYHTGVDAEILDGEAERDVPVYAIADGTVRLARSASGYGGVMLVEHMIGNQVITAVYGHLRQSSFTAQAGGWVKRSHILAMLGTGVTDETDGERKHLHLGILTGSSSNLRGYVSTESALSPWIDPLTWFTQHQATDPRV